MTLHQFNALKGDGEKLIATLSKGECIARREVKNFEIELYDMFSFSVEIWSAPDVPGILLYKSFVNTTDLGPYLHEIDISELIKT